MNKRVVAAGVAAVALIGSAAVVANETLLGSSASVTISPGASWDAAYKAAQPGDTITLTAGTYTAQTLFADASKTSPDDVIFQPAQGASVTVTDLSLGTTTAAGASHVTFRDFKVTAGLVTRPGTDDVTFERMDAGVLNISGSGALGVKLIRSDIGPWKDAVSHVKQGAQNVLIDSSVFHDFTITDPVKHSECLMIWGGAGRTTIRNTVFRNCTDFDVLVKSPSAREIILENSFFDVPMPGNTATFTCNPNCPRGGNAIRYSGATETYAGSAVRDNIFAVAVRIGIDCNCVPRINNVVGVLPLVPPGTTPPPPPPTTTEPPPTTTQPPPTTTEPPPADSLPLTISGQTATTVTLSWTPVSGLGYRFLSGGVVVSRTNDPARASVTFARKAGVVLKVQAESPGPFGSVVSP